MRRISERNNHTWVSNSIYFNSWIFFPLSTAISSACTCISTHFLTYHNKMKQVSILILCNNRGTICSKKLYALKLQLNLYKSFLCISMQIYFRCTSGSHKNLSLLLVFILQDLPWCKSELNSFPSSVPHFNT